MPFLLILIGAVLIVAAYRNTYGQLATALETDVPAFATWGLAIVAVGALGWIPGMRQVSRWLLALVLVVIVLRNYQALLNGVAGLKSTPAASAAAPSPASAYVANPTNPQITQADVSGSSNINAVQTATMTSPFGAFDPAAFMTAFEQGVGGFGGVA
jgi:hypothetical protein